MSWNFVGGNFAVITVPFLLRSNELISRNLRMGQFVIAWLMKLNGSGLLSSLVMMHTDSVWMGVGVELLLGLHG